MRRIHLDANVGRVFERAQKRPESDRAGSNIERIDVRFPKDADAVFLAGREVLGLVELQDRLDLLLQGFTGNRAGRSSDTGNPQPARQLDRFDEPGLKLGIEVVSRST